MLYRNILNFINTAVLSCIIKGGVSPSALRVSIIASLYASVIKYCQREIRRKFKIKIAKIYLN